ncbi:hypothetical protein PYW07_013867 [Mythimna separata]|uniref:Ecdysoneless n=1 Tax=Mythimna separata TaxID=271217 RepID=A0AAD7YGA8_MYTSE|nr:hypothetical protein PYW07_013867 [Mythimna separata]
MSSKFQEPLEPANDDTIQCLFFSPKLGSDLSLWEDLCRQLNNSINLITKDYIWHRDEFQVYAPIARNSITGFPYHLCSTTCFGDNLEDEWFIVHVILEISKQYRDLIIQMKDSDGDFLLIEAANYLQSWANPENTENRVFIYDNHIHIIPPELAALDTKLELQKALRIIYETPQLTLAANDIQHTILNRIGNYPDKINEQIHKTVVKLPSDLATLLTLKPSLVAPIVDAYCNHDIIDAKCCKNINLGDCVTVEVKFTKFLYATLMHSKLINFAKQHIQKENDKKNVLGLKLMCGYQMIMNKVSETDIYSSKEYDRFLNNLKQNGYFKNNIENSKEYNHLLQKAQHYFSIVECPVSSSVSVKISELLASDDFARVKKSLEGMTSVEQQDYVEDNEDWLNIRPDQLNELLQTRYGKKSKLKGDDYVTSQKITEELSSFLRQTTDFEGIEQDSKEIPEQENIEFESDQFVSCIEKMLKMLSTGGKQDSGSESSEDDFDDMCYDDDENDDDDDDCDRELQAKLQNESTETLKDNRTVLGNIIQSLKEEKASTGPSSTLMRSLGVSKSELLDSDDD